MDPTKRSWTCHLPANEKSANPITRDVMKPCATNHQTAVVFSVWCVTDFTSFNFLEPFTGRITHMTVAHHIPSSSRWWPPATDPQIHIILAFDRAANYSNSSQSMTAGNAPADTVSFVSHRSLTPNKVEVLMRMNDSAVHRCRLRWRNNFGLPCDFDSLQITRGNAPLWSFDPGILVICMKLWLCSSSPFHSLVLMMEVKIHKAEQAVTWQVTRVLRWQISCTRPPEFFRGSRLLTFTPR